MTTDEFAAAIKAATTYEEAHEIVLQFQPTFGRLSNEDKKKWRVMWKARKAELQSA